LALFDAGPPFATASSRLALAPFSRHATDDEPRDDERCKQGYRKYKIHIPILAVGAQVRTGG